MECGVHRFGVVRFRCKDCGDDLFVPLSCKRRGVCPSCDAKRAVISVSHAVDALLPPAVYRQWVLVVPKRLRYFIHRRPELEGEVAVISEQVRRKTLRRFVRLGVLPVESAREMSAWEHGGFSLHAKTAVPPKDRAALERLLLYCCRPPVSVKRLEYDPVERLARYRTESGGGKTSRTLVMAGTEFLRRLALLCPAPGRNLIRYYGVLGPNSPLRPDVTAMAAEAAVARQRACAKRSSVGMALQKAVKAVGAAARSWAAALSRVFEVEPLICSRCGGELKPVAVILDDAELVRLLKHLDLPAEYPKTSPPRSPPGEVPGEDSQIDPVVDSRLGIDEPAGPDIYPA